MSLSVLTHIGISRLYVLEAEWGGMDRMQMPDPHMVTDGYG